MAHLQATERVVKREPTHFSELDPKTMKVGDLREELEARNLSSKGSIVLAPFFGFVTTPTKTFNCTFDRFEASIGWPFSQSIKVRRK